MSKTVIITGANSGIGKELAILSAKTGDKVILTVRSKKAEESLSKDLSKRKLTGKCSIYLLDLESLDSVKECCRQLQAEGQTANLLILNAGIHIPFSNTRTRNNFEKHYQVNFLSNVLFTNLLIANNVLVPDATVTYISSNAHKQVEKTWSKLNTYIYNYAYSKFCATTYFLHFQQLYPRLRIKIIHPGLVNSEINRYKSPLLVTFYKTFRTYINPGAAAQNIYKIVSDPDPQIYWEFSRKGRVAALSLNCTVATQIWNKASHDLQNYLPFIARVKLVPVANFARTFTGLSAVVQYPATPTAVCKIVKEAISNNLTIRTVGARHSYNDSFDSKQVSVSLKNLTKIKKIDKKHSTVICQGGVTINKLVTELHKKGLTLPFSGDYGEQTVAGAISTGTHGYARYGGCLSELVKAMTVVNGKGELQTITQEDELVLARLSLGMFGIICEVELNVIRVNRYCEYSLQTMHKDILFNNLPRDCQDSDHLRFLLNPFNMNYFIIMKIKEYPLTKIMENRIRKRIHFAVPERKHDHSESNFFLLVRSLIRHNRLIKYILYRLSMNIHKKYYFMFDTGVFINDGLGNNRFPFFKLIYKALKKNKEYDMEIAVPVESFENFYTFFTNLVVKFRKRDRRFEAFLSTRYLGQSGKVLLAGNYHNSVVYNDVFVYKNTPLAREFLHELEVGSITQFQGKMHWGKYMTTAYPFILQNYPQSDIKKSVRLRKKYDPDKIFSNYYTQRLFGDV